MEINSAKDFINLLGPLSVQIEGRRVHGFRSQKTLALLAFLVAENRPVSREYLAMMLWPDTPLPQARAHLRRALYDLTQKLPGRIVSESTIIFLATGQQTLIDLFEFEKLADHSDEASMLLRAGLCRGEFLEGVMLSDCPQFEHWLTTERDRWRWKAVQVLNQLLEYYTAQAEFGKALEIAFRVVRLQPWHEDSYQRLMLLLVRNGDPAMALKLFKRFERTFTDELGLNPSADMLALQNKIHRLLVRPPTNIERCYEVFSGREEELSLVMDFLSKPEYRLITITGPTGSGRSSLAAQSAALANSSHQYLFLDGVYLVHMEAVRTVEAFTIALGYLLGITKARNSVPFDFVLRYLSDKEMLLVLDKCALPVEHQPALARILQAACGVKFLVTCEQPLNYPDEWTIPLA